MESQRNYPTEPFASAFEKAIQTERRGKEKRRGRKKKERKKGRNGQEEKREKMVGWLSNDWQLLPPSFRAKVQRSEVKARRKNCHEWANRPQAPRLPTYILPCIPVCCTNPRVLLERGPVETYEWYYCGCLMPDLIALSPPSQNRWHPFFFRSSPSHWTIGRCFFHHASISFRIVMM